MSLVQSSLFSLLREDETLARENSKLDHAKYMFPTDKSPPITTRTGELPRYPNATNANPMDSTAYIQVEIPAPRAFNNNRETRPICLTIGSEAFVGIASRDSACHIRHTRFQQQQFRIPPSHSRSPATTQRARTGRLSLQVSIRHLLVHAKHASSAYESRARFCVASGWPPCIDE